MTLHRLNACPLCGENHSDSYARDKRREYLQCLNCALVFVPAEHRLNANDEKAIYDLHENDINDAGYQRFLNRLAEPLLERLPRKASGLEFGCGPGPALAAMLESAGHSVSLYDLFYYPDQTVFDKQYDFITATEVVEHLYAPGAELNRLWGCLKTGGWLGVMTKLVIDKERFAHWHYKNDLTHVCFFSRGTFEWLAQEFNAELTVIGADVVLLKKTNAASSRLTS